MTICVAGTGYVGLVVGVCLSDTGQDVICVDVDEQKVQRLQRGESTIYEPGLGEILARNLKHGRLRFTVALDQAVGESAITFVAVGTPPLPDGSVDMSQVMSVAEAVVKNAGKHSLVVMKSTVPVGTCREMARYFAENGRADLRYVSNPEFLKEGNAVEDFTRPDRVIIGSFDPQAAEAVGHLYMPYMRHSKRIIFTDPVTAELTKYAANTMLAMRISFMNEMARLCDAVGGDVQDVRRGVGSDKRIGSAFLFPGIGYGGFCFPKDVKALASIGRCRGVPMRLAEATDRVNETQVQFFLDLMDRHFAGDYAERRIAAWGLAYKAKTDDARKSHAVEVCRALAAKGARVVAYDPQAMGSARRDLGDTVEYADDMYAMLQGADALVVMTDWQEFRNPDLAKVKALLKEPVIFDGRDLYDLAEMRAAGFGYYSVGRPAVT